MIKFPYTPDWVRKMRGWPMNDPNTEGDYLVEYLDITEEEADRWIEENKKGDSNTAT